MKRGASQTTAPRKRQTIWASETRSGAVPPAVRVYLRDAVARDAVNTLYTLGAVDAVDVVRGAGRNPFQPLLADAGLLDMEPQDVIHPARLVELGLQRPWTRSRTARAAQFVQRIAAMPGEEAVAYLSDGALLVLLEHVQGRVDDAARSGRAPARDLFRGVWVDYFRDGDHATPAPLSLTPDPAVAAARGGADMQAATAPLYLWRVAADGTVPALVTPDEVILPAGTVLAAEGREGDVVRVRVVDADTMPVE